MPAPYNLTNLTNTTDLYTYTVELNNLTDGLVFSMVFFGIYSALLAGMLVARVEVKGALISSGLTCMFLGVIAVAMHLVAWSAVAFPMVIFLFSFLAAAMWPG